MNSSLLQFYKSMSISPILSTSIFLYFYSYDRALTPSTMALLGAWFLSPSLAFFLSRTLSEREIKLSTAQHKYLRLLSRKTWRFFETYVGAEDNFLAPDNIQEFPTAVIAHRTSPTNIGISLLSNLAALDFGYISPRQLLQRTTDTFTTLEKMERFRGHFYNWYDTKTLTPLPPRYVSTVDSGNLCGFLLTLKPGLAEILDQKVIPFAMFDGLVDLIDLIFPHAKVALPLGKFRAQILSQPKTISQIKDLITTYLPVLADFVPSPEDDVDTLWVVGALRRQLEEMSDLLFSMMPWCKNETTMASVVGQMNIDFESIPSYRVLIELCESLSTSLDDNILQNECRKAKALAERDLDLVAKLSRQCDDFATVEYEFLYDRSRHLLSIGYNASDHRRDSGFYDLLASEARLGSFVAIAQGFLPQKHWFALGRLLTTHGRDATLLSWSGSMFEYLMPLLVMPNFKGTLLDQTYQAVVKRHIEYGLQRGVPWGISESGYNTTDLHLNYQYRAFGVPGLGFKRGLAEDLVIAPYAAVMSLMVAPYAAFNNLMRMKDLGFEGRYGFYEAIDYTPSRVPAGQDHAVVRSYMAHHQGMGLLSLAYLLSDQKMPKRLHSDPLFHATELLLHERVPKLAAFYPHAPEVSDVSRKSVETEHELRVITTPHTIRPEIQLLSNGRYSVMVTNSGGGYSRWHNLAVTRWREDPTADDWGTFCYVRELTSDTFWSASFQPSLQTPTHYEAIFPQARAEFRRRDQGLEMHTEITVSPEDDIELRRFSITNLSSVRKTVELTSYAEVVLAPQSADEAHPAFSNLFVQTEIMRDKQALLCTRRARSAQEKTPTLLHLMTVHGRTEGSASFETDRSKFIGRGRSVHNPLVMEKNQPAQLSGQEGSVLDPIVSIRRRFIIEPEQTIKVHIVTGVSETKDGALTLIEKYRDRHLADRTFHLAWTQRQVSLRQLNISEFEADLFSRLAGSMIYANPARRARSNVVTKNTRGQSSLWGYSISGDLPILLLRVPSSENTRLIRQVIQAHSYWRTMGVTADLVIWNEDDSSYRHLLQDEITSIVAACGEAHQLDKAGGIFIRRIDQMPEEDRVLIQTVARAVIKADGPVLAAQVEGRVRVKTSVAPFVGKDSMEQIDIRSTDSILDGRSLTLANGVGEFSADGREYVIVTSPQKMTPAPWSNVLANPYFGTVISESGGAYTWCENAHDFRVTPWHNDALTDRSGEAYYLRDEETGQFWSPTPLPVKSDSPYITRHGFGYTIFEHIHNGIRSELTNFVAIDAPVKVAIIRIKNVSSQNRKISLTGYCEWVLAELRAKSLLHVVTETDPVSAALIARNHYHAEFGARVAFFDSNEKTRTTTCDRSEFLGRNGQLSNPAAMHQQNLSGKSGALMDACAALQTVLELGSNEEREVVFVLGVGRDLDDVRVLLRRFRGRTHAHGALQVVTQYWQRTLGAVQVKTPDTSVNILTNGWLVYQTLACRFWARSGYYQSGGAYGFRDQLQDAMSLLHAQPSILREHLLRCASRQFREGDVQHWWHPQSGRGVRTHFSDDYLWLPLATCRYVLQVGDTGVLRERVNFLEGRHLRSDEEAYSDVHGRSEETATLYEHCVRAINYGLKFGKHGLPLMGCGDWNDGMNLVGEHGQGESVWLAFFLFDILNKFAKVAELHGDYHYANTCVLKAEQVRVEIEKNAWDGDWYRRAYFDNGEPMGSAQNIECQIDSLPQSWSVLSKAGSLERRKKSMAAVNERLIDRQNSIIKLFDPPFDSSEQNPGYIKGYVPGVRENGGQYTHAAIWTAMAYAALGDCAKAWELQAMINPINHGRSPAEVETYKVEPYVISADVYAVSPHTGRGGWSWYTGSAGWMYRLILESLLGLQLDIDKLYFVPCLPDHWNEFEIRYRFRETFYNIRLMRDETNAPRHQVILDGVLQNDQWLPLVDDSKDHGVEVRLGASAASTP